MDPFLSCNIPNKAWEHYQWRNCHTFFLWLCISWTITKQAHRCQEMEMARNLLKIWLFRQKNYKKPITLYIIIKLGCTNPGPHVIVVIKFWLTPVKLVHRPPGNWNFQVVLIFWVNLWTSANSSDISLSLATWTILFNILSRAYLDIQTKLLDVISAEFGVTYQLLIIYSTFIKYLRRRGDTTGQYINSVHTSRKPIMQL